MPADASGVQVDRHCSDEHSWAFISRAADFRLLPYVIDYQGYRERARTPMRRLQHFDRIACLVLAGDQPLRMRQGKITAHGHVVGDDVHVRLKIIDSRS